MAIEGIPDFKAALDGITDKLRKRVLRNALAAGARVVRDAAKSRAPVIRTATKTRNVGTVKKAISVRTSKTARKGGNVGVFVNVKPLRSGAGAKNPNDPFYWRWLEFGWNPAGNATGGKSSKQGRRFRRVMVKRGVTSARQGFAFLQHGASKLSEALRKFTEVLGPQIEKLNKPK